MVFTKLVAICNTCFWLALCFQFLTIATSIPRQILNTIVVLGMLSILVNLTWLLKNLLHKKREDAVETGARADRAVGWASSKWFTWFILVSFMAQLTFLFSKYL